MHGVVSLLDSTHYQLVADLWAELKREFGVAGAYATPYPHFSYQVAADYNEASLEPILQRFALNHAPFQITTTGLGIFTGSVPVLYIPVLRSQHLTQFHQALWPEISTAAAGIQDYYRTEFWMPHITLAMHDLNSDNLSRIVQRLSTRTFNWQIHIDNIALIYDTGTKQELRCRYDLNG